MGYNSKELKTSSTAQENRTNPYSKDVIYDPMGQWNHPGQVTRIPGDKITMKGVPYPVLGVDDQGNKQLMLPGGEYTFPGAMNVTEYPKLMFGGDISIAPINHQNIGKTKWLDKQQSGGQPDVEKARAFLDEGSIYGHPLSSAQIDYFTRIAGPIDEEGEFEDVEDLDEEAMAEMRRGGVSPLQRKRSARSRTSKNIKTSVNKLMMRNQDLFGPSGRNVYDPNAKGWLDKYK